MNRSEVCMDFVFISIILKFEILHLTSSGRVPKKLALFFHQIRAPPAEGGDTKQDQEFWNKKKIYF